MASTYWCIYIDFLCIVRFSLMKRGLCKCVAVIPCDVYALHLITTMAGLEISENLGMVDCLHIDTGTTSWVNGIIY